MKFAHIADTHIRNLKYHNEYRTIFNKIYEILKKEQVDYIIHCGDICHTKTQISPEFVQMCSDFFKNLSSIAPTYIILGNHDGNLRNPNRQDSLSPIISALDNPNLHLLKNAGEVHLDDNFALNVLSVFDEDNWIEPTNIDKINIALYHGSISGCRTDGGWMMDAGEHDASIFEKFDYAMLGDIHLTNQIMDNAGRIRYAGSTVQQNHGETTCKGFLLWNINNKKDFSVKPITITNPKPFITLPLTEDGKIPETTIPKGARLRLVVESAVTTTALKKAVDVAKKRFKPESVSVVNKSKFVNGVDIDDNFEKKNLRDIAVQEKLIREYLEDYKITDELENKITALNKKYKQIVEENDEVYRNVDYEVLELEWSNLFNYGKGNRIDFTNFTGITGVFGKNFSGKSSIIDSLLFTIYNSISKNSRKNLNIINNDKTEGSGKAKIRRGNKIFTIERQVSKYLKRLKGEETVEAKTIVDFSCVDIFTEEEKSLNGLTRADTDKNIIKYFGTIEDFLITSMSSQLGALSFINEGSTKRKEILAKFLDLEIFDKKFKTAKEDAADLKAAIKLLEVVDYEAELKKYRQEVFDNEVATLKRKNECEYLKGDIEITHQEITELEDKIKAAPTEFIDIVDIRDAILIATSKLSELTTEISIKKASNKKDKRKIRKANEFVEKFDIEQLHTDRTSYDSWVQETDELTFELAGYDEQMRQSRKQVELLREVPCGSDFSHCKFIRGAYEAKENIELVQLAINNTKKTKQGVVKQVEAMHIKKIAAEIQKFEELVETKTNLENQIPTQELLIENLVSRKSLLQHDRKELEIQEKIYEENREVIENLENILRNKDDKENSLVEKGNQLEFCEKTLLDLYKSHGYLEQQVESLEERERDLKNYRDDYEAHDLYMKCMHPNGIAYDIIKKSLPTINSEISKILANIVDFQVYFETDDNRLDIYIQQPDRDASPLEMASGAEKTVAAMAIRLAFTNISSLPKSQLFILDEPGTALDAERMEGFVRILDITSSIFKTVILISHLDNLKDSADSIISIEKKDGYANVTA
tara:strand:+ start:299 stop:3442 length:3144 start_codon:yes stop_codon:yes gene_type:complete